MEEAKLKRRPRRNETQAQREARIRQEGYDEGYAKARQEWREHAEFMRHMEEQRKERERNAPLVVRYAAA